MRRFNLVGLSFCIIILAATNAWYLIANKQSQNTIPKIEIESLPLVMGDWSGQKTAALNERSELILQLDQYIKRIYRNSRGDSIYLYIGYWNNQTGDHQSAKHSPKMCLPANGWNITKLDQSNLNSKEFDNFKASNILGKLRNDSQIFRYWFFKGREMFADEGKVLLKTTIAKMLGERSDGGIIELSIKTSGFSNDIAHQQKILDDFQANLTTELSKIL